MNYVLLPIAHGVEVSKIPEDYARPLLERVTKLLTDDEKSYLIPLPYNYTIRTNECQNKIYQAVEQGLGNQELRRLKHTVGSDVTWSFIVAKNEAPCFYTDFVKDMTIFIDEAKSKYPDAKKLCVGHSQGTQLFYSFFFDYKEAVDGFISMGSPISMNSGAYPDFGKVPANLKSWINLYNDMDFVSSRLQGFHPSKAISDFVIDYEVPLGWNPIFHLPKSMFKIQLVAGLLAHVMYWKSDFVAKIIAKKIQELMHTPT